MSQPSSQHVLICNRIGNTAFKPRYVPGSIALDCAQCGEKVWASLASLAHIASKSATFAVECAECAMKRDPKSIAIMPPSKGQIDELRPLLKDHN